MSLLNLAGSGPYMGEPHLQRSAVMDDPFTIEATPLFAPIDPMLRAGVLASHTAMVVSDPRLADNPIVLANPAFCRMTGYGAAELLGRNCRLLQGPDTDPEAIQWFREAVDDGRETIIELLNYRRNGDSFWNRVVLSPVIDGGDGPRYFVASMEDISESYGVHPDPAHRPAAQTSRTASFRWEPRSGAMAWSEAAGHILGAAFPQIATFAAWAELIHPEDRAEAIRSAHTILALGQMTFAYRLRRQTELRWIESAGSVVQRDDDGTAVLVTGVITDITQRRETERALQSRESRTRLALDAARAGAWELDTITGRAITSPRHDEILGHSQLRGRWTLDRFADALLPADRDSVLIGMRNAVDSRAPFHLLGRVQTPGDTAPRWIETWGRPAGPDGRTYYGIVTDVTDRRRSEDALAKTEAGFRLALDAAKLGRWDHDLISGSTFWDDRMRHIFGGLSGAPLEGGREDFIARIHPEDRAAVMDNIALARMPGSEGVFVHQFRLALRGDESPRWLQCFGQTLFEHGQCTRFLGVCQDITEQKRLALTLQDINRTLEAEVAARTRERDRTWRLSQELLGVMVTGQGLVSVNPSWERVLGWTPTELHGRSLLDLVHPDDLDATAAEMRRASAGAVSLQFRNRFRARDRSYRHISWTTVPEADTFYITGRDVTAIVESAAALEQAQAQMRQMQKMEAVGQLTGGIAHDFNNMLSVVMGGLTLMERRIARGDTDVQRFIDAAMDGARRAGALTQRLLAFSRQQPLQPQPLDLGRLVGGMSDLLHRTLGEPIQLQAASSPGLCTVNVDPSQMENVVLNLAVNARDAMPAGGRLSIEIGTTHLDDAAGADHDLPAGAYARLLVSDSGTGMSPEVLARAFEPFFTTKGVGAGTGLGLSQVYGFARQSGGSAHIRSRVGHGTQVTILLPCYRGDAALTPDPPQLDRRGSPPAGKGETVLLVEDEDRVRQLSAAGLRELGYVVIETNGAAAALRALEAHPVVDLLFTDVIMPEVNGRDLADEAQRRRPGLKILFTTGYARDTVVHDGVVDPGTYLLTKPFTIDQLATKLRELLNPG